MCVGVDDLHLPHNALHSPSVVSFLGLSSFYPSICVHNIMYYCERRHKYKSKNRGGLEMKLRYQAMKPMK